MTSSPSTVTVDVHLTDEEWDAAMVEECRRGLTATPKVLSPVWFYDARGSQLFDEITRLPEYYPTRAERSLLAEHAAAMVSAAGADTLVELGSGTSDKTRHLLDALTADGRPARYVPFDVSEATVRAAADQLVEEYPALQVHAVIGDFNRHLGAIPVEGRRLVAFLGSTIGNLDPDERRRFLGALRLVLGEDDRFLLGVDLVKDRDVLVRAYDDADGVTAEFNRNALCHLNDRLGATFDPATFRHVARWDEAASRIEMHLRSTLEQAVRLDALDLEVRFDRGEELRTEISTKFTMEGIAAELDEAAFDVVRTWVAEPGFGLLLARPAA
ncbi:MAG TPA: L-histidine N(alpha)-methyltransferase [Acidimicrobiales bacterium]|nr:L-histidine N(alpha)-methyltransferase [Acidimicrobiales bacterium]